jgi:acetolactate synthase-1/2/3 large subunit
MTGAEALVRSLLASGVDTCFTNPGTSEMHFVAALDRVDGMRCVLALFEGVATGAADGYARMADRPASTLLHLGPGLANGLASLHNAHRALSPIVNIVGEHGTVHRQFDPPLHADIAGLARVYSSFVTTVESPTEAGPAAAAAVAAALAPPGRIATVILPADCAWTDADLGVTPPVPVRPRATVDEARVRAAADSLRKGKAALVLNGPLLRSGPLDTCGRIAAATGAELLAPTQVPRLQRGAGRVFVDRIPYVIDAALKRLHHLERVVLVNARAPVAFFAYPNKPSLLLPQGCEVLELADAAEDGVDAIERLADILGAGRQAPTREPIALHGRTGRGDRRAAARAGHRRRRVDHVGPGAAAGDPKFAAARLADQPRRRHWHGPAVGGWCGRRLPGSQGRLPRVGRQRHVHAPGALDHGARTARRHHCAVQQPHVRDPERRVQVRGRGGGWREGA